MPNDSSPSRQFPPLPQFSGMNAPSRIECHIKDLEVVGELPQALQGTWYRCGPDPQYPPMLGDDIYINGDGAVSAFSFADGRVDFTMRYVRTQRFEAERAAHRSLFGLYRNPYTDHASVRGLDRGTANTTAFVHAGRLFALKEDSLPYELDPVTLETKGRHDFDGKLRSRTVTAHPKRDPETGEWLFFGYEAAGDASKDVAFCVADKHGALVREEWFEAPYAAMQHDFAVTRDYVIFSVFPTVCDLDHMKAGGTHWMWDGTLDTWIGVMRRDGSVKDMRWFRRPACYSYHVGNAFNTGSQITIDLCVSARNVFPYVPARDGSAHDPEANAPYLTRWSFDADSPESSFTSRVLSPIPGELPRIDDRVSMHPHRFIYYGGIDPRKSQLMAGPIGPGSNHLVRVDTQTGGVTALFLSNTTTFQEPQLVPVPGAEGLLLAVVDHHDTGLASVVVLNAADITAGPIAQIKLPIRLRDAFHGDWAPLTPKTI
jgi:carotenoid cleavage dioxygenase-like enzyme